MSVRALQVHGRKRSTQASRPPIVKQIGGWKTEGMRRYATVTDATLRAAAGAVSASEPRGAAARAVRRLS